MVLIGKEFVMKRQFAVLLILITLFLSGCGDQPLKFRNLLEADQYIRNNIENTDWNTFKYMLSPENTVTETDFNYLKERLTSQRKSYFHTEAVNKFYRFNKENELIYMTEWEKKDGILLLKDIDYIQ
jgi:hypothetical protein